MFSKPKKAWSHRYSLFRSVLDSHAPLKKAACQKGIHTWMVQQWIQATVVTRNHLHRKATLTNNASNWRDYCLARNRVVHLIRNAKRYFYRNSINNHLENPKNLWCIIRSLLGKISAQSHVTLCIQLLTRENNEENNTFLLGKQICFTIVWACAENFIVFCPPNVSNYQFI